MSINIDLEYLEDFCEIYLNKPIKNNLGGMGFNHSYALFSIIKKLQPKLIIESGIWRGHSTYIIEKAAPDADIVSLDINLNHRRYISNKVSYYETDFNNIDWSKFKNIDNSLCFFDDHQNSLDRLKEMKWWGFQRAVFEDNFPIDQGDSYSLKQIFEGVGHPSIQLSKDFKPKRKKDIFKRKLEEKILMKYYFRQNMIVKPNEIDKKGLKFNLKRIVEIPPVLTGKENIWGKKWEGSYKKPDNLIKQENIINYPNFEKLSSSESEDFEYSYITYIEII